MLIINTTKDPLTVVIELEKHYATKDPRYVGLTKAVIQAYETKSVSALTDLFKQIGGDPALIALTRQDSVTIPYSALSNLIPLSVGAPLGIPISDKVIVAEFNTPQSSLIIPKDDLNNEHEVFTNRLYADEISAIYTHDNKDLENLRQNLANKYPDYFRQGLSSQLGKFATEVSLHDLLTRH